MLLEQYRRIWYQTCVQIKKWTRELNKNYWHSASIWFGLSVQVYSTSSNGVVVSSESKYRGSKLPWEEHGLGTKSQDATARAWWALPADVNAKAWCAWGAPIWPCIQSCEGRAISCWAPRWVQGLASEIFSCTSAHFNLFNLLLFCLLRRNETPENKAFLIFVRSW